MISMELIDTWIPHYFAWWAPYAFCLCIPALLAWYPGSNARLRGHENAHIVSGSSWLLVLSILGLYFNTNCDLLILILSFAVLWTGIAVWSYGKNDMPVLAARGRGFEIIPPRAESLPLELAVAE